MTGVFSYFFLLGWVPNGALVIIWKQHFEMTGGTVRWATRGKGIQRNWYMAWWRHQMETFSGLLAICAGNSPVPTQRPVMWSFDDYFDLRPDKRAQTDVIIITSRPGIIRLRPIYLDMAGQKCIATYLIWSRPMRLAIIASRHFWCIYWNILLKSEKIRILANWSGRICI